jgi:hypothetical protein
MPDFTIALAIGLVIGFIRATPRRLSLVCWTAHPAAAPLGLKAGRLAPLAVLKQCADAHAPAEKTTCKDQTRQSSNGDRTGAAEGTLVTMIAIFLEASPLAVPAFWPSGWP